MLRSIPIGVSQDKAIEDIVQLVKDNNITLNSIGFSKGITSKDKIGVLQVSAGFEGTYEDLITFLKALEQNKRMFRVNSISVQLMNTEMAGLKRAVFSLSMDTFYQE
jgi:Tfp pilus assembly protein PilO